MKSKILLEILESDVLKSIASQNKGETFEFVRKILNNYDFPCETAGELIIYLEHYIEHYHRHERDFELANYVDEKGDLTGKYKEKKKVKVVKKKKKKEVEEPKLAVYVGRDFDFLDND